MITNNLKKRIFTSLLLFILFFLIYNFNFFLIYSLIVLGVLSLIEFYNAINKIIYKTYVSPKLGAYLDSVLCGIKYFSETGNKVSKNQFGYNSMFSSR